MKNTVTITIAGETKSGKSRIAYIVKELLKVHGFKVEFDPSPDFTDEGQFNKTMRTNFDDACEALTQQTEIVVKEVQLQRDPK